MVVAAGGAPLLVDVSLRLGAGESAALRGPSGCGKTTLLRAVAALDEWPAGEVLLAGRPPAAHGWPQYRRAVVLVAQAAAMLPGTVRENLERPFAYRTAGGTYPAERARALLDRLAVGAHRLDQQAGSLSAGQRQRVAFVRALLVAPQVLLLDEPTSALDEEAVARVEEVLAEERRRGLAILAVTHDAAQAARIADRVVDLGRHVPEAARGG